MRILPWFLVAPALVAQAPVPPQASQPEAPLSAGERAQARKLLSESRQAFLASIEGLTPAQWTFKPAPDRWSIQECAEHLVSVEELIQAQVVAKALAGPREPLRRAEVKVTDGVLLAALPDRSQKAKAPEMLVPKGRLATREAVVSAFEACRKAYGEQVEHSALDWRSRFAAHPYFGPLDVYQWVLLASGHTARHTLQIDEVKRSLGFPAADR
jgi:hypothetical protein